MKNMQDIDISYKAHASETMITGGQPDREQLRAMAEAGIRHVINLRPVEEQGEDEAPLVEGLGMRYYYLPVAGPQDVDRDLVARLDAVLREIGDAPAVFHCATSNRVGGLLALHAAWHAGKDAQAALEYGRRTGMTRMEPRVRQLLESDD